MNNQIGIEQRKDAGRRLFFNGLLVAIGSITDDPWDKDRRRTVQSSSVWSEHRFVEKVNKNRARKNVNLYKIHKYGLAQNVTMWYSKHRKFLIHGAEHSADLGCST